MFSENIFVSSSKPSPNYVAVSYMNSVSFGHTWLDLVKTQLAQPGLPKNLRKK